jgi:hypothetical protein
MADGKVLIELIGKDAATQIFTKSCQDIANSFKNVETSASGLGKLGSVFNAIEAHWKMLAGAIGGGLSFAKFQAEFDKWASIESALLKMSKRLNDTVENISALGYVAKKTGMDADAFNVALERMQRNVSNAAKGLGETVELFDENGESTTKASKTLDELGLRADVLNKLPLPQKLKEISSAMHDNIAPADQSRVAMELFGKSSSALVIALREGPEAIQKWIDRYQELGGVLTTEGAEAMSKAKTAVGDLTIAWNHFSRELYEITAPALTYIYNKLADAIVLARQMKDVQTKWVREDGKWIERESPVVKSRGMVSRPVPGGGMVTVTPSMREAELAEQVRKTPSLAPPAKAGSGGGGGGGGIDRTGMAIENFVQTMQKEIARASGDSLKGLEEWFNKQSKTLEALEEKAGVSEAARTALKAAHASKRQKIEEDFSLFVAKESGDAYAELEAQGKSWLAKYQGFADAEGKIAEIKARRRAAIDDTINANTMNLFKGYLDTMAGLAPILEGQLKLKRQSLDLELKIADAALERQIREKQINPALADQARGMAAVVAQAKKFDLEMKNNKGLSGWASGRVKTENQKNTWADAMEGLESFVTDAFGQGIQGALSKTKVDFMEVAKTMAQSLLLNLAKQGIHKAFSGLAEALAGGSGQMGTDSNPMVVTIKGAGLPGLGKGVGAVTNDFAMRADKTGYTMRGGGDQGWEDDIKGLRAYERILDRMYKGQSKDMGGIQKLQERFLKDDLKYLNAYGQMQRELTDQNKEMFKAEYLTEYQDSFGGMVGGITSIWQVGQGLMTAAGVSGEAQRYGAMVTYGIQGIALITQLAKGKVLVDAAEAAASGYASVMEALPWPINVPVAAAWAALAFAGTMAAGAIKSSAGGDYQVDMTGPRYVHKDETILPSWAAQGWRDIVSRESSSGGSVVYSPTYHINAIDARGVEAILAKHGRAMTKVINRELGRRGRRL